MSHSNQSVPALEEHEVKKGMVSLFFTQIFSTFSYSIIYSTLVLYGTGKLGLSAATMNALMGGYLAFNFGLHFLGGYMGGRFISNRMLFIIGVACQVIACFVISFCTFATLMMGLAIFLTGSGLNVTCMNNMVTQLFDNPEDPRREKAFLWNYSGMNIGFFLGFAIAGYFQLKHNFMALFIFGGCASTIAILSIIFNWHAVRDRETYLTGMSKEKKRIQFFKALGIIFIVFICLIFLLKHADLSNALISIIAAALVVVTIFIAVGRKEKQERNRMTAFVFFLVACLVFWTLYQLAPMGLVLFIEHNVNLHMFGIEIAPQWVNNINTVVIVLGGPIMAWLLEKLRARGHKISLPFLFSLSLILIGIGFAILPIGIHLATKAGIVSFVWIFASYILQSLGELCISPIGYAMIGKLIPRKLQSMMMGLWCMMTGVAAILASYISNFAIGQSKDLNALTTNHSFAVTFGTIGIISLVVGFIMATMIPRLYKLINNPVDDHFDEETPTPEAGM